MIHVEADNSEHLLHALDELTAISMPPWSANAVARILTAPLEDVTTWALVEGLEPSAPAEGARAAHARFAALLDELFRAPMLNPEADACVQIVLNASPQAWLDFVAVQHAVRDKRGA